MSSADVWVDTIKEAFEESNITATQEQIKNVASWAEGLQENWSLVCHEGPPDPDFGYRRELKEVKKELERQLEEERTRYNLLKIKYDKAIS